MSEYGPGDLQQRMLALLGEAGTVGMPTIQLAQLIGVTAKRASKAAAALIARRYAARARIGIYMIRPAGKAALASGIRISSGPIDKNASVLARRITNSFRDRLWTSMRLRRIFTLRDIVADAEAGEKDAENDAGRYVRILSSAGYVRTEPGREPGTKPGSNGFKRFRLVKDTGPRAPLHRSKVGLIHDFNTGEDVPCTPR